MKFAFFISKRYLFSKNNRKSITSKISKIAIITTALSIMMPLLMLSLMNGFHDSIKGALMENEFHIVLYPISSIRSQDNNSDFKNWYKEHIEKVKEAIFSINNDEMLKNILPTDLRSEDIPKLLKLKGENPIQTIVPYVEGEGLIKTSLNWQPIVIKGLTPDIKKSKSFKTNIKINAGNFEFDKDYKIMIGKELAKTLEINFERVNENKGQFIDIITDIGDRNIIEPRIMQHQAASIYTSGYMEIDSQVVFTTAERAMYLLNKNEYSGIGIQLKDYAYIETLKPIINKTLKEYGITKYFVRTGTARFVNQFRAFDWEKNLIFFVVVIMILASFLTIFITLNILVINKQEEIGTLRSIGVNSNTIRLVFLIQGFFIGLVGSLIGVIIGIFVTSSINEIATIGQWFVNEFLRGLYKTPLYELFGISTKPGEFNIVESSSVLTGANVNYVIYITDMVIILIGSIFTSLFAAFFPSLRATRKNIVEVLRYE